MRRSIDAERAVCALLLAGALVAAPPAGADDRPNILWITAEDMSPALGSFGDVSARTPHLDALAAQGIRYTRAFAPIGVCAPARSSLLLGAYAPTAGSHDMRSGVRLPDFVKPYPRLLREAGYYTTNNEKEDYNLEEVPEGKYREVLERLRGELRRWLFEIHDAGFLPEAEMHLRAEGTTPWEMVRDPSRYDLPRLFEAAERASLGSEAECLALLRDADAGVRYWGASGLIGLEALSDAARSALSRALSDPSPDVTIAAAEALAAHGAPQRGLEALQRGLEHPQPAVRLRAATVLDGLGASARPLVPAMRAALAAWRAENHPSWRRSGLPRVLEPLLARLSPEGSAG